MDSSGNDTPSWAQLALRIGFFSLRNLTWRRKLMFYLTLVALSQLGFGLLILDRLSHSIILFVIYWGTCVFLVCLMLLLALYDMLAVRQGQQLELKRLRERMFEEGRDTHTHADDSGDPGRT
ncbi:MAG: hypothetical protein ACKVHP_25610 [Verrucomicrobiales bacterium]|jgi:hypothetical protein